MIEKLGVEGESRQSKPANYAVIFHGLLDQGKAT
jgi:hypothetical protein